MEKRKLANQKHQNSKVKRTYWGVDVANGFIILNNGNPCTFYLYIDAPNITPKTPANFHVLLAGT